MTELSFGVNVPTSAGPGDDPVGLAQEAERLGFDFVSAADHPCGPGPSYETPTMLTWIAARTSRIKVATRVLAVPFRRPAMVAKLAASLDQLSGGRFILGLGPATTTKRSPRSAARRCRRPKRSTGWPKPSRSSGAAGRDPASPSTGATTASATSSWSPGRPSRSPSGWGPSARGRWRSPAGWPTAGFPRSATGRRGSFPRCGAGSTPRPKRPAGGRKTSAACSTWPSASIRPPGRSQTW